MSLRLKFISLLVIFGMCECYGQYEFDISYMSTSGSQAYLLKPAPCFELVFNSGDMYSNYRCGVVFGFMQLQPTQDTFRIYAVGGPTGGVLPGYEVIHKYQEIPLGMRNEFALFPENKISPIIGLDVLFYVIQMDVDTYDAIVQSEDVNDTYWTLAVLPRLGVQYRMNENFLLDAGFGRSISFTGLVENQSFWKTYIGFKYYINR